jgi:hypothetical protein
MHAQQPCLLLQAPAMLVLLAETLALLVLPLQRTADERHGCGQLQWRSAAGAAAAASSGCCS